MPLRVDLDGVNRLAIATNTLQAKKAPTDSPYTKLARLVSNTGRLPSPLLRTAHV